MATEVKVLAGLKGVQTKSAVAPSAVAPSQGSEAARGAGKGANLPRFTMDRSGEVQSNRPSFHEGSLQGPSMASHRGMPPSSNSVSQEPGIIAVPKQPSLGRQPRTSERSAPGPGVLPASVHGPTTGVLRTSVPSTLGAPHRATGLPPQGRGHRRVSGSGVHGAQSGQVAPPAVAVAAASASARQSSGPDRSLSPSGRAGSVGAPQKQRRPSRLGHGVRVPGAEAANTTRASAGWSQLEDNWRDGSSHRPWLGAQRDAEGPRSDLQRSVTSGQQALAFEAPAHYELQPKASSPPGLSWMSGDASNGHGRGSRGSAPGEAWAGEGGSALGARRTTGGSRGSEPGVRRMTGGSRGSESGARERSQGSQGSEGRPTVTSGTSRGEAWARPVELGANAWAGVGGDGTAVLVDRLGELDSPHLGAGDLHVIEEDDGSLVSDRRSKRSPLPSMSRGARSVFEGRASAQRESILKDEAPQDSALDEVLPVSAAGVATPSASVATGGASFVALESTEGDAEGEMDGARGAGGPVAESQEAWGSGNESSKRGGGGAKGRALGGLVGGLVSSEGDEGEFASARRESVVRFGDVEDLDSGAVGSPRARSHGPGKEARPSRLAVGERAGEGSVSSVKAFQNLREALAKGAERDAGESVVGSSGRAEASGLKPALKKGGEVSEARRKSRLAVEKSRASSFASAKSKKGKGGGLTWGMTQVEGDEDDISIKEPDQLQGMVQMVQELQMLQAEVRSRPDVQKEAVVARER